MMTLRSILLRALLPAALLLAPLTAPAAGWDIGQLMQALAKVKSGQAAFVEKKYLSMLNQPLESSGELRYAAPDHLEKITVKPKPESMVIDGDTLTIEHGRQKLTVQLQEYPELAGFIDSVRGTLAGNRAALEHMFKLSLDGDAAKWMLSLKPADPKMARSIHLIRISGSQGEVRTIDVIQTDGDRSVTTITHSSSQ